jgi:asparagine synthase
MTALFLVRTGDPDFADVACAAAGAQLRLQGLGPLTERALPGWRLLHAPYIQGGPESLYEAGDDLVAVAGTLVYDGKIGRPALAALLRTAALPAPDWSRIGGHFTALIRRCGRTFLLGDYFAAYQLFHDPDMRLFSTSLLAAAYALPRLSFDTQGVYEFAFNVLPVGDDTVFSEIKTLGPNRVVELTEAGVLLHEVAKPLPAAPADLPLAERIERQRARLSAIVRSHLDAFERMNCPLSGGLDSRLVLALMRAEGHQPNVFVYGDETSADVRVARDIGEAMGFTVDWLDKEAWRAVEPVARNFHDYDGLPNYGELFENGANGWALKIRHAGGALSASGSAGEIMRNFFFLPDRPTTAAAVAKSFFARYDRRDVTDLFDERAFLRRIEDKILGALGMAGERGKLPRPLIEHVYPRVRARASFGREISLETRHGGYLTPFMDHQVVAEAMTLPIALKNAGRFEAALLAAIDPELAAMPSAYGYDFAGPPGRKQRCAEYMTRMRPAWLRQRSYEIRRRMGPVADEHGGLLGPDYVGRVVDLDFPTMRRWFRIERIDDSGMMRRIANLEYVAAKLGTRLASPGTLAQQSRQLWVQQLGQWIDDHKAAPDEAVLHILRQQEDAAGVGGGGHDQRVPILQLVVDHEVGSGERGSDLAGDDSEPAGEFQQDPPRLPGRGAAAPEDHEQLAEGLDRNDQGGALRKVVD